MADLIPQVIVDRYDAMLAFAPVIYEPDPGTTANHLRWMLAQLRSGDVYGEKAHRWLGFVQGILIYNGYTTTLAEREFITRPFFKQRS